MHITRETLLINSLGKSSVSIGKCNAPLKHIFVLKTWYASYASWKSYYAPASYPLPHCPFPFPSPHLPPSLNPSLNPSLSPQSLPSSLPPSPQLINDLLQTKRISFTISGGKYQPHVSIFSESHYTAVSKQYHIPCHALQRNT